MKHLLLLFSFLLVVSCGTQRKEPPPQIITQTEIKYRNIPDRFLVCPPPPVTEEEVIAAVQFENEYNEELVLKLFRNNEECYRSIERANRWNEDIQNDENSVETD